MRSDRIGAGLSDAELGLRLGYEIRREFAPYVGISYEAKAGQTARYARADGDDPTTTNLVAGVPFWFQGTDPDAAIHLDKEDRCFPRKIC